MKKKVRHTPNRKTRKTGIDIDTMLMNTLVILLVVISILSVIMVRDYIGYVGYHGAKGGTITEINVYEVFPASIWNGIAGIAIQSSALNSSWYVYTNPAGMSEINPIFPCFEPGITHELYATTLSFSEIAWDDITAGTTELLDDYASISYNQSMSATQTFTSNISVDIGDRTISNVPAAYMRQYGVSESEEYPVGILQQNGTIIMVAVINDDYLVGYRPDKIFNFEMMVPVPTNATNLRYNIYTDPFDECPAGEAGETVVPGNVYGWVTDDETGEPLENAIVAVERKIYVTGADGFYNITELQPGTYYIVGLKTAFNNYVSNITIFENASTEHNISMIYFEDNTGTGSGIGTGVGPGEDDPGTETKTGDGPGIGPGVGPGIGPFIEKPEEFGKDHWVSLEMLKKKIRKDTFFTEQLLVFNFRKEDANINVQVSGNVSELLELSSTRENIPQNNYGNISIRGLGHNEGRYVGLIEVSGDFNDSIPVDITVTGEDKLPVEALLMNLEILTRRPLPGKQFRFRVNLQNLLIEENYDVRLDYYLRGVEADTANNTMYLGNDTVNILTSESILKDLVIPSDWQKGDYYLIVEANYLDLYARSSTIFELFEPIQNYKVFGLLELWKLLTILGVIALILGIILFVRHQINSKKRFHAKVEYKLLPKDGPRSLYVGKIAETERDTYFDMDKLTVHSIIAGSTGGGKSISAQVIIEECLKKDIAVVVFDPTAQWSGMLRKCQDEKMMAFYPRFHLTKKDARAFNGNIRAIKNPLEKIDLQKYWKPGEIQVFTTSTLDPKGMDIFVANTVRQVFKSNLQEYRSLRYMMVYDEVHRLLPKFGGSGEGFVQIERACREFRKWGIGVMLISQVLADFVGQIKANINTEVQMKTRDEGDLERIKDKYGPSFIQELVKSPVGSGMVQNSAWNRGQPYYVTFRPILHSVVRLSDEELEEYNKYNLIVEDLTYQLDQLEEEGKDVFDLRLELKLSLDKIKQGAFNMVEIYLEGLKPRIEKIWKELGKTPKKKEMELVSEEELMASVEDAKKESEKAKAAEKSDAGGDDGKPKALGLNDEVPPDKMLTLVNGTLVVKLKALLDEVNALKEDEFKKHVNEEKNDFSDWIRNSLNNDELADLADPIMTKEDYVAFLEALDAGNYKGFKPKTARQKPYSSKKKEQAQAQPAQPAPAGQTAQANNKGQGNPPQTAQQNASAASQNPQSNQPLQQNAASQGQGQQNQGSAQTQQTNAMPKQQAQQQQGQATQTGPNAQTNQPEQVKQQKSSQGSETGLDWNSVKQKLATLQSSKEKIDYLTGFINTYPNNPNLLFSIAAEYHRSQDLGNAETYYKKAIENNQGNTQAMYYLANIYSTQKRYQDAIQLYNRILQIQPGYPKVKEYIASIEKLMPEQEVKN